MFHSRSLKFTAVGVLTLGSWLTYSQSANLQIPPGLRALKNTFSPLMEVIKDKRVRVTDEQLAQLKTMQIENLWGAVQNKGYKNCFISHLKLT